MPDFNEIQRKQDEEHAATIARIAAYVAEFKEKLA